MSQAVPKCPHCQEGLPCITPGLDSSLSLFSAQTCPLSHQERGERRFGDVPRWLRVSFPAADTHLDVDAGASLLVSQSQSTSGEASRLTASSHGLLASCRHTVPLSRPWERAGLHVCVNGPHHAAAAAHDLGWESAVSTGRHRLSCVLSCPAWGAELSSVLTT